nr:hypothetical protein BaRGS_031013 [Batillaria attramentaria]
MGFHVLYVAGVVCNAISLLFLIPACGIFLYYRSLRKQHRIRIHLNLFLSFLLTNGSLLLWEILVYRDRLLNAASDTNMHKDSLSCKILYVTTRYAWTAAFFWMFLEGFHLYRLISRAFQAPRTICGYYIVGWVSVYTGFRVLYGHEK